MDRESARKVDINGWITIEGNPISKEGVYDYMGSQIPGYPGNPDDIVKVYRPMEELMRPETIESFKLLPFIDDHVWLGQKGINTGSLPFTGITGEGVYADAPYLRSNLKVFSEELKADIIAGKVELSPGYLYDVYLQPGVWNGQPYQYVQRNLRGNHLALVLTGRTGSDVAVMDSADDNPQEKSKMTLEELLAAIGKLDDVSKAALMAGINHMGEGNGDTPAAEAPATPAATTDAPGDDTTPAEQKPAAAAATDADPATTEGKAMDAAILSRLAALETENKALKTQVQGMDSAESIMKAISDRNELAQRVSVHIGAFACDSMTAQQVAAYGLEKMGIKDVQKGAEVAVLNGVLAVKQQPTHVAFGTDAAVQAGAKNDVASAIDSL
jgi:hypothetical protein